MHRQLAAALVLAAAPIAFPASAAEVNNSQERAKSKLVSRLYQASYGSSDKCSKATPEAAKEFEQELSRWAEQNAKLVNLLTQSVHYESAQARFAKNATPDPARDTPESIARQCKFLASLMREMNDTEKGRQSVKEYEAILSN